ncbi:hypothetical protein LINPERPRIM_LOCUS33721 [Linum perenne]
MYKSAVQKCGQSAFFGRTFKHLRILVYFERRDRLGFIQTSLSDFILISTNQTLSEEDFEGLK